MLEKNLIELKEQPDEDADSVAVDRGTGCHCG